MQLLKCCGIREKLENYDNIDLLGFNFISYSKRKIDKQKAKEISQDILKKWYKNIQKVGLFDESFSFEEILDILDFANLDAVQLYSNDTEIFKKLKNKWYFLIKPINLDFKDFEKYEKIVDLFIVDGKNPWSGKKYDYSQINNLNLNKNFLVAGWVSVDNAWEIVKIFEKNPFFVGLDVASGVDNGKNIDLGKVGEIVRVFWK